MLIDTHSHLFVEEFTEDLPLVMERAQKAGVSYIFMPNIDIGISYFRYSTRTVG